MYPTKELLKAKKLILQYQQEILDLYQVVNNLKCSLLDMHQKYLSMEQKYQNAQNKNHNLQIEIDRLLRSEHHVSCSDELNSADEYIPNFVTDEDCTIKQKDGILMKIDIIANNSNDQHDFYKSKIYERYATLKLLVKTKVKNCRLESVCNVFNDLLNKKFNVVGKMLQKTSRYTADR
eukprot:82337_1